MREVLDIKESTKRIQNACELIEIVWQQSQKNHAAIMLIAGMLDGLRWADKISAEEYSGYYDEFVFGTIKAIH